MPPGDSLPFLQLLRVALRAAGDEALARLHRATISVKGDGSPVSDADRAAEDRLIQELSRSDPSFGIVSEEGFRNEPRPGAPTWYLDPIDGTSAFLEGLAHWGPTVCLVDNGVPVVGAFWTPRLGEFWYAARGRGAWLDDHRLTPPVTRNAADRAILCLGSGADPRLIERWPGKVRALGSSAAHLCQVARGSAVVAVVPRWETWDVGCGVLLVEETGGAIRRLDGAPFNAVTDEPSPFVAGAPEAVFDLTRGSTTG